MPEGEMAESPGRQVRNCPARNAELTWHSSSVPCFYPRYRFFKPGPYLADFLSYTESRNSSSRWYALLILVMRCTRDTWKTKGLYWLHQQYMLQELKFFSFRNWHSNILTLSRNSWKKSWFYVCVCKRTYWSRDHGTVLRESFLSCSNPPQISGANISKSWTVLEESFSCCTSKQQHWNTDSRWSNSNLQRMNSGFLHMPSVM